MERRRFLGGMLALGCQGMLLNSAVADPMLKSAKKQKRSKGGFDENLVILISDLHCNPGSFQSEKLQRTVKSIMELSPRPRNVVALGDLAYLTGLPKEYALLHEILAPLEEAGIRLTLAMGNHDRRSAFAAAFPKHAAATLLQGRYVYIVETPRADIIVLDSLNEDPKTGESTVEGVVNDEQREWLRKTLANYTKPVFVTAHHATKETKVNKILLDSPTCCGYIHGHDHVWRPGWFKRNYSKRDLIRTLCLPSTGHWGDIGYTLLHMEEDRAVAELHQYEYFFPSPLASGEEKPLLWKMIEEEHRGMQCGFAYRNR